MIHSGLTLRMAVLLIGVLLMGCRAETAQSQSGTTADPPDSTEAQFEQLMAYARTTDLHERRVGTIMQELGLQLMERPYLEGTLDEPETEQLVIRFDGFDCVTFVETMLALARGVAVEDYRWSTFARHVEGQRYRGGTLDGYCSRLHYFSEWIAENDARGTVRHLTETLGGIPLNDSLDFMSVHREAYPSFATNDSLLACIRDMETRLHGRAVRYVPQDEIRSVYDRLRAGDIVALATNIDGLDVAHTGLVFEGEDGRIGLLHASTEDGVTISPDLQTYVQNIGHQIGILVARPTDSTATP